MNKKILVGIITIGVIILSGINIGLSKKAVLQGFNLTHTETLAGESEDISPDLCDTEVGREPVQGTNGYEVTYTCIPDDESSKCKDGYVRFDANDNETADQYVCEISCKFATYH
jgi:hypothetical protein